MVALTQIHMVAFVTVSVYNDMRNLFERDKRITKYFTNFKGKYSEFY